MIKLDYPEKVYAGLLGKCIGVRLGAPVEPTVWSYKRIRDTYGDICGYVKDYKNFAADDDVNGPIFFVRALYDYGEGREITAEDIGNSWLNYIREGKGFFWWGGYGRSTEHTAYLNLKYGIKAPFSGSIEQNGYTVAEQIGGQIFIDSWGLIFPGKAAKAARYAEMAASVSHDRNGIYGGRFIAAAIAVAFDEQDPNRIIRTALNQIPNDCEYARVTKAVIDFHAKHSDDFRACRDFLEANFGYDRYPGVCPIIPNAGVCILSLLYGGGSLSRTVEIATMCGWDTDCNAGNVGTIMGVANGLAGIEEKYRKPINDFFAASSIAGSLNILDLPTEAKRLALLGYRLSGEAAPYRLKESTRDRELYFDFYFPGSTHGFRVDDYRYIGLAHRREEITGESEGSLCVLIDRLPQFQKNRVFYKPFYRRSDFSDERYSPAFTPQVYPGQQVSFEYRWEPYTGTEPALTLFVRKSRTGNIVESKVFFPESGRRERRSWRIPDTEGEAIDEIGITIENREKAYCFGKLFLYTVCIDGRGTQLLEFSKETIEFNTITQTTYDGGVWVIKDEGVQAITSDRNELYTGNYYTRDVKVTVPVIPQNGESHMIIIRAKGRCMSYFAGFNGAGKIQLVRNKNSLTELASVTFNWKLGTRYLLEVTAQRGTFTIAVDGVPLLEYTDPWPYEYGMYGLGQLSASRTLFGPLVAQELP